MTDFIMPDKDKFLAELRELLKKWHASIHVTDDGELHGMHSPMAIVYFDPIHDADSNKVRDFGEFELPRWVE